MKTFRVKASLFWVFSFKRELFMLANFGCTLLIPSRSRCVCVFCRSFGSFPKQKSYSRGFFCKNNTALSSDAIVTVTVLKKKKLSAHAVPGW